MVIIHTGTSNDELIIQSDSTSVQAGMGTNTVVFSGNYADYTLSQSDSFVSYVTHNTTGQVTSLYGIEHIKFTDGCIDLSNVGDGQFMIGPTGGSIPTYF